jgi:four helix bundle suffix protein
LIFLAREPLARRVPQVDLQCQELLEERRPFCVRNVSQELLDARPLPRSPQRLELIAARVDVPKARRSYRVTLDGAIGVGHRTSPKAKNGPWFDHIAFAGVSLFFLSSKETEIKLTNVARASLEELLTDYRDFLRTRDLKEWPKEHRYAKRLRELNRIRDASYETFRKGIENPDPVISTNVIIGLIKVTTYLLDQQLRHLETAFAQEGGLRERMTRARLTERAKKSWIRK